MHLQASQSTTFLNKTAICLERKLLIVLYITFVEPFLHYGILVWAGTYKIHLAPLIVIQNCIVEIILHKPRLNSTSSLSKKFSMLEQPICTQYVVFFVKISLYKLG